MKMTKQKVFALALAVCLIATLSMGSLAWFTDSDSVTNDFLIAGSEDQNPDDVFSVDVWEDTPEGRTDAGYTYKDILPGDDLYKNVNVENTGSYEQYVRVTVTVTNADIWQAIYGVHYVPLNMIATDLSTEFQQWSIECDEVENTLTYVLYYNAILPYEGEDTVTLFTNVHIPEELTREQADKMEGGFQIAVTADAVQTRNVGNNAAEAFATVGMHIEPGNRCIMKDVTIETTNATSRVYEDTIMENVTINSTQAGFQNMGADVVLEDVTMNAGSSADYSNILHAGSTTTYNDVEINSAGGGVAALGGAQVTVNGDTVITINSTSTSQRHIYYAMGEGTVITINGGTYAFEAYRQRSYACATDGAIIYITGGTFGVAPNHQRWTHPIYTENGGQVIITGGTFGFDPTAWVADGYTATYDATTGTWTVA